MEIQVLKSCSFQHVLDRAIGLAHFTDLGYAVVGVRPNAVILERKNVRYEVTTVS
jgi:hypothetical protein